VASGLIRKKELLGIAFWSVLEEIHAAADVQPEIETGDGLVLRPRAALRPRLRPEPNREDTSLQALTNRDRHSSAKAEIPYLLGCGRELARQTTFIVYSLQAHPTLGHAIGSG